MTAMIDHCEVAAEVLRDMFELLQYRYCHDQTAIMEDGSSIHYSDKRAVAFDLYGALYLKTRYLKLDLADKEKVERICWRAMKQAMPEPYTSAVQFCKDNPDNTPVLEMLIRAITELFPGTQTPEIRVRKRIERKPK